MISICTLSVAVRAFFARGSAGCTSTGTVHSSVRHCAVHPSVRLFLSATRAWPRHLAVGGFYYLFAAAALISSAHSSLLLVSLARLSLPLAAPELRRQPPFVRQLRAPLCAPISVGPIPHHHCASPDPPSPAPRHRSPFPQPLLPCCGEKTPACYFPLEISLSPLSQPKQAAAVANPGS